MEPPPNVANMVLELHKKLELRPLWKALFDSVCQISDSEYGMVLLVDDYNRHLQCYATRNHEGDMVADDPSSKEISIKYSVAGQILRRDTVHTITELIPSDVVDLLPLYAYDNITHITFVPMRGRNHSIGVLCIYSEDTPAPTPQQLHWLTHVASHAAIAIENIRINDDSRARAFEVAVIRDTSEVVSSTLALNQILSIIGKGFLQSLQQISWCEIFSYSAEQHQFVKLCSQRSATWSLDNARPLDPKVIERIESYYPPEEIAQLNVLTAPIPEVYLALDGAHDGYFAAIWHGETRVAALKVAAIEDKILDRVKNVPLADYLQHRGLQIFDFLQKHDVERAQSTLRSILRETEADGAGFWIYKDEVYHHVLEEGDYVWKTPPHPLYNTDDYPEFKLRAENLLLEDFLIASHSPPPPDIQRLMRQRNFKSMCLVPFKIREDERGILLLGSTNRDKKLSSRQLGLIQSLVVQAANAIQNAQLYAELQDSLEVLRETQGKLVRSARLSAIGELSAAVAHQINNPLTTILGDTQLLLTDIDTYEDEELSESVQAIHRAGQRAYEVVRRLLSMARQKSDSATTELLDINNTIRHTLTLVESTIHRAGIDLMVDLADELPLAFGLAGQLEDVWLNLILNSRDALRDMPLTDDMTPIIGIRSRLVDGEIEVRVWDNGPGLPVDKPIFQAFFTTKPMDEGTGLGLYICKTIIENCNGTIESGKSKAGGAEFIVKLHYDEE